MSEKTSMFELLNERMGKEDIVKLVCNYDNKFNELEEENKQLKHKLEIANNKLNMIKRNAQVITPNQLLEVIENYTGFFGKGNDEE